MCFSKPKAPAAPAAPPPPAPFVPPVLGKEQDTPDELKRKKFGYSRLQIPLAGTAGSGLNVPV